MNTAQDNPNTNKLLLDKLANRLGRKVVDAWFTHCTLDVQDDRVCIFFKDAFMRDWVNSHYIDHVHTAMKEILHKDCHICLDVIATSLHDKSNVIEQYQSSSSCTFDNFIVGKTNELAYTAAVKVCEEVLHEKPASMNPLFIYGDPGVGKSHLLSAINAHVSARRPDILVTHMTAEQFVYEFIKALQDKDPVTFKDGLRASKLLLIDDVHFIIGKNSSQEEFFHTFNYLRERNCQIILSSDQPAYKLEGLEDRLKSRLGWGLTVEIHQPNYELRVAILQYKVQREKLNISQEAIEFLASNVRGNLRDLEGAWLKLESYSKWFNKQITIELIRQVLSDFLQHYDRKICIGDVHKCIAEVYGVSVDELQSGVRKKELVRARHIGIYLARELTESTLEQIANAFGGRDHTAIMYGVKKIKQDMQATPKLQDEIQVLIKRLKTV